MRATATIILTSLLLALATVPSQAQDEVMVEVTSIAASMRPEEERAEGAAVELDARLRPFSKSLRSLFAYDRYVFLGKDRIAVRFSRVASFPLPEHFSLEVTPEQHERRGSDMIEMMVTLVREVPQRPGGGGGREPEREVILRTQIRLKNGGTVLLGGPPIRSGVLVLALSARG